MRRRTLREDERELWAICVRDVTPLARLPVKPEAPSGADLPAASASPPTPPVTVQATPRHRRALSSRDVPASPPPAKDSPSITGEALGTLAKASLSYLSSAEAAIAAHLRAKATRHGGASGQAVRDLIGARQPGLDTRSWKRLATGQMAVERRLDLHGMTAQAAFMRLHAFLLEAHRGRVRCVEIVTGLGSGPEGGILRRELPFWLGRPDLKPLVLAATHSHHANQGAVRVLLRRHGPPATKAADAGAVRDAGIAPSAEPGDTPRKTRPGKRGNRKAKRLSSRGT